MSKKVLFFVLALFLVYPGKSFAALCGDGIREGLEECDNGTLNSDSQPNACRTSCVLASCGDGTVDSGEECDDYASQNSDKIPNACRRNCKRAHCGDGVLDEGEECDDTNANDYDGCSQCRACYPLKDDLTISSSLRLCPGTYEIADKGQEGILILGEGADVDATDVVLIGVNPQIGAAGISSGAVSLAKTKPTDSRFPAIRSRRGKSTAGSSTGTTPTPSGNATPPTPGTTATIRQGTGIVFTGNNAVMHNATVQNYKTGIKVKGSGNLLYNNCACGNSNDITTEKAGNFGVRNACKSVKDWQENGAAGCMNQCQ